MDDIFSDLFFPFWFGALAYLVGTMVLRNILDHFLKGILAPIVILLVVMLVGQSQSKIASDKILTYGVGALSTSFAYERFKTLPVSIQMIFWVTVILSPFLYFSALGLFG